MLKGFGDNLIVKPVLQEEKQGLVIVPKREKDFRVSEVVSLGEDVKGVKVGDKVIYDKYAGMILEDGEGTFHSIAQKDIKAILEK